MNCKVKIEVLKGKDVRYYTGYLKEFDDQHYKIETIKNESLIFRKEQIVQIQEMRGDENEGSPKC